MSQETQGIGIDPASDSAHLEGNQHFHAEFTSFPGNTTSTYCLLGNTHLVDVLISDPSYDRDFRV